jgi:ATP-dependent protease HslVU (ClpYQ) ATPase subunit
MANDTAQLAGMLPHNAVFREWVTTFTTLTETVTVEQAAQFIRYVCEVESRAELATNEEAARRFHTILRRTFIAWRDARHRTK